MGQIWDFLRSVSVHFGSPIQNVLKLIFKIPRLISFGANLTNFRPTLLSVHTGVTMMVSVHRTCDCVWLKVSPPHPLLPPLLNFKSNTGQIKQSNYNLAERNISYSTSINETIRISTSTTEPTYWYRRTNVPTHQNLIPKVANDVRQRWIDRQTHRTT